MDDIFLCFKSDVQFWNRNWLTVLTPQWFLPTMTYFLEIWCLMRIQVLMVQLSTVFTSWSRWFFLLWHFVLELPLFSRTLPPLMIKFWTSICFSVHWRRKPYLYDVFCLCTLQTSYLVILLLMFMPTWSYFWSLLLVRLSQGHFFSKRTNFLQCESYTLML